MREWARDWRAAAELQVAGMAGTVSGLDTRRFLVGRGRPCVVIPGVYEAWYFMRPVIDALQEAGHPVHVLAGLGRNRRPVTDGADHLAAQLDRYRLDDVTVVAHSKGGLIAKYAMLRLDPAARIRDLVAIATPFAGSRYANWAPNRTLRAFRAADPVTAMLAAEREVNSRITSVYGRDDPIVPEGSELPGAVNVRLPIAGHFAVLRHPLTLATAVARAS
ncbi:hypothetical protein GCM10009851_23300 [Herbiconiux moechotypicola]|uniref:AB hydrolase-1 domain-containing protein n=1 Tax=Herbiconiux moechotypicola TaxID=637393 RepID=A0ABP5QMQ7_9MICO